MSKLSVATIETEDGLTNLTLKTGNTSGPAITIYAQTGEVAFDSPSNVSITATAIDYSGVVTYSSNATFSGISTFSSNATFSGISTFSSNATFSGISTFSSANIQGNTTFSGNTNYTGNTIYTGTADFSSANVVGEFGISTGKAIAMAIVFG